MKNFKIVLSAIALACLASQAQAALTVYTSRAAWEAAVGGSFVEQNFSSFTSAASYQLAPVNVGDFSVSMTGDDFGAIWHNIGPSSNGNDVNGSSQINAATGNAGGTTLTFSPSITAFGGEWDGISDSRVTSVNVNGDILDLPNLNSEFWGFVSTTAFTSPLLFLSSGQADGFAIDNIVYVQQSAVPEPGTLAVVALGLLGLAATRRRKA